jgi:exodeoxyribonuclease VIII
MKDIMIDLETLGQNPDTCVISLGACVFDIETGEIGPTFYMALDVEEQMERGRSITADTLKWWMGQSGAAKKVFHEQAKSSQEVLQTFKLWVEAQGTVSKIRPWGNGSSFDISIMEDLLRMYKVKCPWLFYNVMDMRTFRRFVANNAKVEKTGTNHNALDDAKSQAQFCIDHYKFFKEMISTFEKLAKEQE